MLRSYVCEACKRRLNVVPTIDKKDIDGEISCFVAGCMGTMYLESYSSDEQSISNEGVLMQVIKNSTNKLYQIVEEALDESNCKIMVIYKDSENTYCREKTEFWDNFSTPITKLVSIFTKHKIDFTLKEDSIKIDKNRYSIPLFCFNNEDPDIIAKIENLEHLIETLVRSF